MSMTLVVPYVLTLALVFATGCSSSDNPADAPQPDPGDSDSGAVDSAPDSAVPDAPEASIPIPFSISVYDSIASPASPMPDVLVVVEQGGAKLAETSTGDDGTISIDEPDWSLGDLSITAFSSGYVIRSLVGVNPETLAAYKASLDSAHQLASSAFLFLTPRSASSRFVGVKGALPQMDAGHFAAVTPTIPGTYYQKPGTEYSLRVLKGLAFGLVAADVQQGSAVPRGVSQTFFHWRQLDVGAAQSDIVADFDSSAIELTPTQVNVHLTVPEGDDGPLGGTSRGYFWVTTVESGLAGFFGAGTDCAPSSDGARFDCAGEYVVPQGTTPQLATQYVMMLADGAEARVIKKGAPVDGQTVEGFHPPIPVTVSSQSLSEPLATIGVPDDAAIVVWTIQSTTSTWQIYQLDAAAAALSAPVLPDAAAAELGTPSTSFLQCAGPYDASLPLRQWTSTSRSMAVQ